MTPRTSADGVVVGWQMFCRNPNHMDVKCTKQLNSSVAGSEEMARRMLKTWLSWGVDKTSRAAHFDLWGNVVVPQAADGRIPSEAWLDEMAVHDWVQDVPAPSGEVVSHPAGPNPLGDRHKGVALALHEKMEEMARRGDIPVTSPSQRLRHRPTKGSEYFVPKDLQAALACGYIAPGLPPPRGLVWKCASGGKWRLRIKGA